MFLKRFRIIFAAAVLSLTSFNLAYSADDEIIDESKYVPKVKLSSNTTIEISNGKTQDIIIEVKNVGTGRADNFFVSAVPGPDDPFTVSLTTLGGSNTIQSGASKQLKLTISVESGAAGKVYPLKLNYSYINAYRASFDESDTLNIKVNNPLSAANIRLYNFELSPPSLKAGETGELTFNYMNRGTVTENNVRISLEGLDTSAITVPGGLNSQNLTTVSPYTEEKMSFKIKASSACKNGVYPIKIVTSVKNNLGETATEELDYFVSVGGALDVGDATLNVIALSAPQNTFSVGENFNIGFSIQNTSKADAENVLVKAEAVEGNTVVPTSQSMFMIRTLKAGETKPFNFTFAATSEAKTQNYPITFTIEYDSSALDKDGITDKIKFNQYFGVNISNPEKKEDDEEAAKNVPKIIVSSYNCDPIIVKAGSEFDLNMTFMNTHSEKPVKNIKVALTVTDKEEKVGASIFSPVNASNTLYIDQIAPKQTVSRSIRYYAIPNANPQNYSINVNFEYEDALGNEITAQEIVGINVSQPPSIETTEITLPDFGEIGTPVQFYFEIFNTGNVTVDNVKVTLDGDMQADNGKTFWIGSLEKGQNEYVDMSFYYNEPGQQTGKIIVNYDSTTGEHFELPTDFSIMINEPAPMDFDMPPEMPQDNTGMSGKNIMIAAGICIVLLAAIGGFFGFKLYKKKRAQAIDDFFGDED